MLKRLAAQRGARRHPGPRRQPAPVGSRRLDIPAAAADPAGADRHRRRLPGDARPVHAPARLHARHDLPRLCTGRRVGVLLAVGMVPRAARAHDLHPAGGAQLDSQGGAGAAVRHLDGDRHRAQGGDRLDARHFPIVIDTVLGLRSVDPDMLHLARVSRASPLAVLAKIGSPVHCPSLFAGMKVGISFALVGAIVGEFVAGSKGLGFQILVAQGQFDTRGLRLPGAARHLRHAAVLHARLCRAPTPAVARLPARPPQRRRLDGVR